MRFHRPSSSPGAAVNEGREKPPSEAAKAPRKIIIVPAVAKWPKADHHQVGRVSYGRYQRRSRHHVFFIINLFALRIKHAASFPGICNHA